MKAKNWTNIDAAGGANAERLTPGGYVIAIDSVQDYESREYLEFVYDIAEGKHQDHFADEWGRQHPYAHSFKRWYGEKAEGFFRQFLDCLEKSNRGRFDLVSWQNRGCNEQEFVGLRVGMVLQTRKYTNGKGEDKEVLDPVAFYPAQDIRDGKFEIPDPVDQTTPSPRKAVSSFADDDIPFEL